MKNLTFLFLVIFAINLTSCKKRNYAENYRYGNENMTRVQSYDQNGNLMEYFIAQSMYNNLMRQGGQTAVNNYYYQNRASVDRNYQNYKAGYAGFTKRKAIEQRRISILNDRRNKIRSQNTIQKSISSGKMRSSGSSISLRKSSSSSFKNYSPSRSSYRSSSFRSSRR